MKGCLTGGELRQDEGRENARGGWSSSALSRSVHGHTSAKPFQRATESSKISPLSTALSLIDFPIMSSGGREYSEANVELDNLDRGFGEEHVALDLDDTSQAPKMRRLLADSDWNQLEYFGLSSLSTKKKSEVEIQAVKHSGTRDYYEQLNNFITDLEDMASGKCDSEEEVQGTLNRLALHQG